MKVIFLDIDGVMQPFGWQKRHSIDLPALQARLSERDERFIAMDRYDIGAVYCDWAKLSVEGLRYLCVSTGANIVISSAWRRSKSLNQLRLLFSIHNLDSWIIDETPQLNDRTRAEEIEQWLLSHPDVESFVVLDDDYAYDYEKVFPGKYVISRNQLDLNEIRLALKILSPNFEDIVGCPLDQIDFYSVAVSPWFEK